MDSQTLLRNETMRLLSYRRGQSPHFSKKQLAHELGINPEKFYQFLQGKHSIKLKTATKYFSESLPKESWERIENAFFREESRGKQEPVKLFETDEPYPIQTADQYEFNADPLSWALLFLFETEDYNPSLQWKAHKLGLTEGEVVSRLARLERLDLIEKVGTGYRRTGKLPITTDGKRNLSIVQHRTSLLPLLARAFSLSPQEQYFYNWYCALDPEDFAEFQKLIRETIRKFEKKHLKSKPKRVYSFMVGLFPMTN